MQSVIFGAVERLSFLVVHEFTKYFDIANYLFSSSIIGFARITSCMRSLAITR